MLARHFDIQVLLVVPVALLGAGLAWWWGYPAGLVGLFVALVAGAGVLAWEDA